MGCPLKNYQCDEEGHSDDQDNEVLPLDKLLLAPSDLGVSYEYWDHLARQYLLEPNQHTPSIAQAIAAGNFRVPEEEFALCLSFYWHVVIAIWRNENDYIKTC